MGVFSRAPAWLIDAIGMKQEDVPNVIPERDVMPVLDVTEGGWGLAQTVRFSWSMAASTAATSFDLLSGTATTAINALGVPEEQYVLWGLTVLNNTADNGQVRLAIDPPGAIPSIALETVVIPSSEGLQPTPNSRQFFGDRDYYWCPPGFRFILRMEFATGVGETVDVAGVMSTYRSGFKCVP